MTQETLEEVSERYANESFVPMRNSDGEILRIPSGQTVPCGFKKHKKVAIKHFTNGYKLALERSYSEEEVKEILKLRLNWFRISSNEFEDNKWFEQFKKKSL